MAKDPLFEAFPGSDEDDRPSLSGSRRPSDAKGGDNNWILLAWERVSQAGLGETVFRLGTHLLSIIVVLVVIWGMRAFYVYLQANASTVVQQEAAFAAELPTPTPTISPVVLPPFPGEAGQGSVAGISRLALIHTTIPTRPRTDVITYTVETGDTIFGIAERFGLKPQSVLWGNTYILGDDPHSLRPGQILTVLPSDGTYHRWSAGEGLNGVARGYGVVPETIISWPGNHLNPDILGDWAAPRIEPGTMLFVPGGERDFVNWSAPRISRSNPGIAKIFGPGYCGTVVDGAVGIGAFIWPTDIHYLSGYDYSPETNHRGIDISGETGDALYASDNGVIVYAGWHERGYGNVVVIDHGNGWQTLYAHMSVVNVNCGQSVYQGDVIGLMGSTGNSTGSHLHYEMLHETYGKVNPWDFLPPP